MWLGIKKPSSWQIKHTQKIPIFLHAPGIILSSRCQSWGITEKQNKNARRFNMGSSHRSNAMNILVFSFNWYIGTPFLGDDTKPEFDYEIK